MTCTGCDRNEKFMSHDLVGLSKEALSRPTLRKFRLRRAYQGLPDGQGVTPLLFIVMSRFAPQTLTSCLIMVRLTRLCDGSSSAVARS